MSELKINGSHRIMDGSTSLRTLKEINTLLTQLAAKPSAATGFLSGRPTYSFTTWVEKVFPLTTLVTNNSSLFELASDGIKVKKNTYAIVSGNITRWGNVNCRRSRCSYKII